MSNQTDEIVVSDQQTTEKQPTEKRITAKKVAIGLFILLLMILLGGFVSLNLVLTKQLNGMKIATAQLKDNLSTLKEEVDNLHQTTDTQQQSQQASVQQDQLTTDLYTRLVSIDTQLEQLPFLSTPNIAKPVSPSVATTTEKSLSWWKKGLQNTWQALGKIVIVRHLDAQAVPLVMPEEKLFLYQNLHAQMETAIWALLHHNGPIYQASLARVIMWIPRYFIQDAPATTNVLEALQTLQQAKISTATAAQ
jgi:uncharacterized protein HemX